MDLSTKELKGIAKIRGIKGYKSMSELRAIKCSFFTKTSKKT